MFGRFTNFLKRKNYVLPLLILLCTRCFCTSAAFLFAPRQIVAGTDRLTSDLSSTGKLTNRETATKIVLLRGRFIVACIGLERIKADQGVIAYDFPRWIRNIESQITSDTSILQLVGVIEKESSRTLTDTVPIEKMMRSGAIKHSESTDRLLVQFLVAGFDNRIPTLIQVYYEFDWQGNRLIGPTRKIEFPLDGSYIGLFTAGKTAALQNITDPNSYAYKRMRILAPTAFPKMLAMREVLPKEGVRAIRVLMDIEAEVEPAYVGNGSTVIFLPISGNGSVTEYQSSAILPKTNPANHKKQP